MTRKSLWLACVVSLAGLLVWLAFFWQAPSGEADTRHPNTVAEALPPGGDFTLQGPEGKLSLADFRGKWVLVYFGYTFCPDICPTALSIMAQAFVSLSPDELERVQGIFVSVDPDRDTPEVLKAYGPFFHPRIVGVSGTPAEIAEVARRYGVRYIKQAAKDGAPYAVDHSSLTYLVSPVGKLLASLPHGTPAQDVAALLRKEIKTGAMPESKPKP